MKAFLFPLALFLAVGVFVAPVVADSPPNVVIIFTDDQGYGDLSCYGETGYATPHIDSLAEEGVRFTDFYVAACVCTPSRAALLTGSHPMRVGLGNRVLFPYSDTGLNPDELTLAEVLKQKNYATACIGKWHLGHHAEFLPMAQGFDYFYGIPYSNDMGSHHYATLDFTAPPLPLMRQGDVVDHNPPQATLTRRLTEEAVLFMKRNRERPFFLYLPHPMPHVPIDASPEFKGSADHGLYGDVIAELDWSVGEILSALDRYELAENTLVFFSCDNGPVTTPASRLGYRSGSAGPLRGNKNTTWEGGMRVPGIARWPSRIPAGQVRTQMVSAMDLLPTLAGLVGIDLAVDRIIDGKDIWPVIAENAPSPHEAFYFYRDERLQAVRSGDWKLHVHRPEWSRNPGRPMLYNLRDDIGETSDLAASHPDVVQRLQELAELARADLGDAATGRNGRNTRPVGRLSK